MRAKTIFATLFAFLFATLAWAQQTYPTSAVSFLNIADRRADWWKSHYIPSSSAPLTNCAIFTAFEPHQFSAPCKRVLAPKLVFRDDEINLAQGSPEYARVRTSLFVQPLPFTPVFMAPDLANQQAGTQPYPIAQLSYLSKQMEFGNPAEGNIQALAHLFGMLQYQWGLNLSFEDASLTPTLRVGYDYWLAAANQAQIVCMASPSICFSAIWVTSTKAAFEPPGFARGIAFCSMDSKTSAFHNSCSFMAYESVDNRTYVKAMVGSPMAMGGGALADDFGGFRISCQLPTAGRADKLLKVKSTFGFEGVYKLDPIEIEAETGFRYFAEARKYGRLQMSTSADGFFARTIGDSDELLFKLRGRWWNANRDDQRQIPMFEDEDVITFKPIFERALSSKDACNVLTRNSSPPVISQR